MSDYEVRVEPNEAHDRTIAILVIVNVGIVLLSCGWVELRLPPRRIVNAGIQGPVPRDLNGVFETLIDTDRAAERLGDVDRRTMSQFGWIDRRTGVVRVPIDRAMEIVAGGKP